MLALLERSYVNNEGAGVGRMVSVARGQAAQATPRLGEQGIDAPRRRSPTGVVSRSIRCAEETHLLWESALNGVTPEALLRR